ncbi:hypothetical protein SFRURICE_005812 [Spodoptera frugiperda]|nr:hypothetical protein SFRURICE_005812 [Spodoptera frugiperda]
MSTPYEPVDDHGPLLNIGFLQRLLSDKLYYTLLLTAGYFSVIPSLTFMRNSQVIEDIALVPSLDDASNLVD